MMKIFLLVLFCLVRGSLQRDDIIVSFEAIDEGQNWVALQWTVSQVSNELIRYRLITDGIIINDIACFNLDCQTTITLLSPCSEHNFELYPLYFNENNGTVSNGVSHFTSDRTNDAVPKPPTDANVTLAGSVVVVSWQAPEDDQCVVGYDVCYTWTGDDVTCANASDTNLVVGEFQYCVDYTIDIRSETESGKSSIPLTTTTNSVDAVPGVVTDLRMLEMTPYEAHITWDLPEENATCAAFYSVSWRPVPRFEAKDLKENDIEVIVEPGEFGATVYPLVPCLNYSFTVWALNENGDQGQQSAIYDTAEEIEPAKPSNVEVITLGVQELFVSWEINDATCVDHFEVCWTNEDTNRKYCINVYGNTYHISELLSCTGYAISVKSVSPDGVEGPTARGTGTTDDEVPGAPTNFEVLSTTSYTITMTFDPPIVNPQCVAEYVINYTDLNNTAITLEDLNGVSKLRPEPSGAFVNEIDGLQACSTYEMTVHAVSPQELVGPSANTQGSTTEAIPSAVVDLEATAISTTEMEVHWYLPVDNNRCAAAFNLLWVGDDGTSGQGSVVTAKDQFNFVYFMNGLTPCMRYEIAVTPRTPSDEGGSSDTTVQSTRC